MISGARRSRSPVRNSQARTRLPTLPGVIWASGENRDPPRSPPQCSHAKAWGGIHEKEDTDEDRRTDEPDFASMSPQAKRNACGSRLRDCRLSIHPGGHNRRRRSCRRRTCHRRRYRCRCQCRPAVRCRLVHHGRRRTANHHDFILGSGAAPRRLAIGPLRRIGIDALDPARLTFLIGCGDGCALQGQVGAASATFCGTRGVGGGDGRA